MGQDFSLPPELVANFDTEELRRLSRRFNKLDADQSGTLSLQEITDALPELAGNPVVARVLDVFDIDGNSEVDFVEFVNGISRFTEHRGDVGSRLHFVFQVELFILRSLFCFVQWVNIYALRALKALQ